MFIFLIILLAYSPASNLYASGRSLERRAIEQIPVRKSILVGNTTTAQNEITIQRAQAKTTLRASMQLTLEESTPIKKAPNTLKNSIKDSMITDGVYGAGL